MTDAIARMELADDKHNAVLTAPVEVTLAAPESEGGEGHSRFAILAYTGAPIDWYGWRFVIRLAGITAKPRFPVLYEHSRTDIVGHADDWDTDAKGLHVGGLFSNTTDASRHVRDLAGEGFPWQASMGVRALKTLRLERGQKDTVNGHAVEGPIDIWEQSEVSEVSFVALGADGNTEARIDASQREENGMDAKMRAMLAARGLPEAATDEEALAFAEKLLAQPASAAAGGGDEGTAGNGTPPAPPAAPEQPGAEAALAATQAEQRERERVSAIMELSGAFGLNELQFKLINNGTSVELAQKQVLAELAKNNPRIGFTSMEEGRSESDKFRRLASQGMLLQLGHRLKEGERPEPGVEDFRHLGLRDLAKLCLERAGYNVRRMSNYEVAKTILTPQVRLGAASVSDFSGIFLDVLNNRLRAAYTEAPATWRPIVNVISAADFREIYGVDLSAGPGLEDVGENEEYRTGSLKDTFESFHVIKRGKIISLSMEMIINDNLGAFARLPVIFGGMTSRKHADVIYGELTGDTRKMRDGYPLFHANHANLAAAGTALSAKSLDVGYQTIAGQRGQQGEALDLTPRYLLVPPSLRTDSMVVLTSSAMPVPQMSSGVVNVWQNAGIEPIVETRLETGAALAKPWYLLADPSMAPVIDVAFMDGQESPDVIEHMDFTVDAISYKVRSIMGAGVTGYRGAYKNPGVPVN